MPTSPKKESEKCSGTEGTQELADTLVPAMSTHSDFCCENLKIQIEIQEKLVESMRAKQNTRNRVLSVIQKALRTQKDIFENDNVQQDQVSDESSDALSSTPPCATSEVMTLEVMKGVTEEFLKAMRELDDLPSSSNFCCLENWQHMDEKDENAVNEVSVFDTSNPTSQKENEVEALTESTTVDYEELSMEHLLGIIDAEHSGVSANEKRSRRKGRKKNFNGSGSGGMHSDPYLHLTNKEQHPVDSESVLSSPPGFENSKTMELLRALRKREHKKRNILFKALNRFSLLPTDSAASPPSVAANDAALASSSTCTTEEQNEEGKEMNHLEAQNGRELPCWLHPDSLGQDTADEASSPPSYLPRFCSSANSSAEVVHDISSNSSFFPLSASTTANESRTHSISAVCPPLETSPPCLESQRDSVHREEDDYSSDFEDLTSDVEEKLEVKGEAKIASTPP